MSAGWEVGDLALCVDGSPCGHCGGDAGVDAGCVYRVESVESDGTKVYLAVEGERHQPQHKPGVSSHRFRKIRPDEHEGNADDWNLLTEQFGTKVTA